MQVMGALESDECDRLAIALQAAVHERSELEARCGQQELKIESLAGALAAAAENEQKAMETSR
jgi:hypothetical protein